MSTEWWIVVSVCAFVVLVALDVLFGDDPNDTDSRWL